MKTKVDRSSVDLSAYPDLVVIYLGMKVRTFAGLKTLLGIGPQIRKDADEWPEGLLHVDQGILFSLFPLHVGMRWYWRDFESMEKWTRSSIHRDWWKTFLKDSGGTGFWHETYCMRGGIEAIYDDVSLTNCKPPLPQTEYETSTFCPFLNRSFSQPLSALLTFR